MQIQRSGVTQIDAHGGRWCFMRVWMCVSLVILPARCRATVSMAQWHVCYCYRQSASCECKGEVVRSEHVKERQAEDVWAG
jgi:hypothetical protein